MGQSTVTVNDDYLSTTGFHWLAELRAMKDRPYRVVDDMLGKGLQTQTGGERVFVPWEVDDHSVPTRISGGNGYAGLRNIAKPTHKPGSATWGYVAQPVFISEEDRLINRGETQQIDLWKSRIKNVERHMRRSLEQVFFRTAAAGGTYGGQAEWIDFLSPNGADQTTGFIEAAASGTNTLHGVTKASYPVGTHPQFHNKWFNGAGSFSSNGLNGLYSILVDAIDDNGNMNPSDYRGYISKDAAKNLKRALRPAERYVSQKELDDGGAMAMVYHGVPLTISGRMPSTGSATTAAPWSVLFVNWADGMKFIGQAGAVMRMDPVQKIPGTLTQIAVFHLMGQLVCPMPGLHGLLSNADAW